jgi:anti-anti-sigma regulatory factor
MNTSKNEGENTISGQAENNQAAKIPCGELLEISRARELHDILRQSLESSLPIEIDASAVERVDAASLQLFCAFMHAAATYGREVRWLGTSQALADSARLLQLGDLLALPKNELV